MVSKLLLEISLIDDRHSPSLRDLYLYDHKYILYRVCGVYYKYEWVNTRYNRFFIQFCTMLCNYITCKFSLERLSPGFFLPLPPIDRHTQLHNLLKHGGMHCLHGHR